MVGKARHMKVQLAPDLIKKLKKRDVRLRKSFTQAVNLFSKNPESPQLNNHELRDKWAGSRSIDITADWRAVYEEIDEVGETVAHFVAFGTHKELYG